MLIAAVVLISYLIAVVVAGHGVVPMAALLVKGDLDSWWAAGKIVGWIGVIGLVAATFMHPSNVSKRLTYQLLASAVLYLSWLVVAIRGNNESGSLWSSFVLSAPFQLGFLFVAYRRMFQYKRVRADTHRAP